MCSYERSGKLFKKFKIPNLESNICFDEANNFSFSRSSDNMKIESSGINIGKCQGDHCQKDQTKIDEFFNQIAILIKLSDKVIDFNQYLETASDEPVHH